MHIFDPGFIKRGPQRRLGKAGAPRQRQRPNVDHPLDPRLPAARPGTPSTVVAFVADGENPHRLPLSLRAKRSNPVSQMDCFVASLARNDGSAMSFDIHIIGGGLAGSEAAWQLAEAGLRVRLSEMRGGGDTTPAHDSDRLAEMVCSNSFRSRRCRAQCRRPAPPGNARARFVGHALRRPAPRARRLGARRRPRSVRRRGHRTRSSSTRTSRRPRTGRRPARPSDDHRHRPADRLRPRRSDRRARPAKAPSPSSTPSPPSSTATASTWTSPGWRPAGTRAARTTSTARSTSPSTRISLPP